MIITIDGPSASGKGTLARRLAAHYGLPHLDTGMLYRAVGMAVVRAGADPADAAAAAKAARALTPADRAADTLRGEAAGAAASIVAAHPAVRAALLDYQRTFAARPGGAVLDGRDTGTVICPQADAKLFVIASVAARARRRALELGQPAACEAIAADLAARDARDMNRSEAPLRPAADALLLDTTELDIDAAVHAAIRLVDARLGRPSL